MSEPSLVISHTPEAIAARLEVGPHRSYLRDLVYGAIDGTVTTFAVVAGVRGASLEATVVTRNPRDFAAQDVPVLGYGD